jgi:signal transduction histidine kinase
VRMQQVFINLLNNALKFTDKGEITFGYTIPENENTIRFFVRDTGIGIPQAQQIIIFKRFLQTREGEKQKYNGTGLGLAISKGIVELMGGELQVDSKINNGSEFYFTLPLNCV